MRPIETINTSLNTETDRTLSVFELLIVYVYARSLIGIDIVLERVNTNIRE